MDGLSVKEQVFCLEYVKCLSETEAKRRAGYTDRSEALLERANIATAVEKLLLERAKRLKMDADFVLEELVETIRQSRSKNDFKTSLEGIKMLGQHVANMWNQKGAAAPTQLGVMIAFNRNEKDDKAHGLPVPQGNIIEYRPKTDRDLEGLENLDGQPEEISGCGDLSGAVLNDIQFAQEA